MTLTVKIAAFCDVTLCSLVDMSVIRVDDVHCHQTTWHYIPEESSVFSTCYCCRSVDLLWQLNSRMHKVIVSNM